VYALAAPPRGDHIVTFRNRELRRAALMVQGMAVDGRKVVRLDLTAWVRHRQTRSGPERDAMPALVLTFYDELRCEIGVTVAGPFLGDAPWRRVVKAIRVPAAAREAMLRLGLFGATGEISFDDVRVTPILAP
jgi:protein-L-isoaspartate(D-aspartate) O-methyltransferase